MKRILTLILTLTIVILFNGCWEPDHPNPPNPAPGPNPGPEPGPDPGPGPDPVPPNPNPGPNPGPDPVPDPIPVPDIEKQSGKISKIVDGDTCTVRIRGVVFPVTVHLYGVDAPEVRQELGDRSKAYFEDLVEQYGSDVKIQVVEEKSRWSKVVWLELSNGWIYNYEVVRTGWAWERDSGVAELVRLAAEAEQNGYGIWKSTDTEEPWVWRSIQGITEEDDKNAQEESIGTEEPEMD